MCTTCDESQTTEYVWYVQVQRATRGNQTRTSRDGTQAGDSILVVWKCFYCFCRLLQGFERSELRRWNLNMS